MSNLTCKTCGFVKPEDSFSRDRRTPSGRRCRCKACDAIERQTEKGQARSKKRNGKQVGKRSKAEVQASKQTPAQRNAIAVLRVAKWVAKNPEKFAAQRRRSRAKPENKKYYREYNRAASAQLSDWYVRRSIAALTGVSAELVPDSMVELKREHLRLVRLLKEKQA